MTRTTRTRAWPGLAIAIALLAPGPQAAAGPPAAEETAPARPGLTPLAEALAPRPYDPEPFRKGLAAHYLARIQERMGIAALDELPLYQLDLELDPARAELVADQQILFRNPYPGPLPDLVLRTLANARHLARAGARLTVEAVTVNGRLVTTKEDNPTALRVELAAPLQPGERLRLGLRYRLAIPRLPAQAAAPAGMVSPQEMMQQLYGKQAPAGYGILGHLAGVFNLGYFYPVLAARAKGAWEVAEPAAMGDMAHFQAANFLVKVRAPQGMRVVSSGIRVGERPQGSGPKAPRETFLLATAVRNFALQLSEHYRIVEKKVGQVRLRYVHLAAHEASAAERLAQAASALAAYQKLFGPYPWPELDVVEAPLLGGAGGVEYPGLVTVAMGLGGGPTGNPDADLLGALLVQTQTCEFVLAHELAHQWWHGLVGSDSNAHPFLDEALANYSAILYFEAAHGQAQAAQQLEMQLGLPYQLMRMLGGPDGVVDRPTAAFANQLQYSALVYSKGALFYHALRRALGRKRFLAALRTYARRQAFRQAGPDELVAALAEGSGRPKLVRKLYRRWILERHGDEDLGRLDPQAAMSKLMGQMQGLQGPHGMKVQGLDPATLRLFQDAVRQMTGGP